MEDEGGVQKLFYELSSESRLSILGELQVNSLRMQPLARKLDLTDTEAFRQLQRLSEALLIQKETNGTYSITQYGRLVMHLSNSFNFAYRHRDLLLNREVTRLPEKFIDRIGELAGAEVSTNMFVIINALENIIEGAEEYVWAIAENPTESLASKMHTQIFKGVKFRVMYPESIAHLYPLIPGEPGIVERRTISDLPVTMIVTEKEAGFTFVSTDERPDYVAFRSSDPVFTSWVHDLFLYYWELGKPGTSNYQP
jgi:predicted transcriptional regulator